MSRALSDVLKRARQSPFYRSRLGSTDQWGDQPLTTKADLRAAYPFGLLAVDRKQIATYHESSGTEGKPVSSFFSEGDWQDIASRFNRNAANLNQEDTFFVKTPYSMVTTAHQAQVAARAVGATVVPADNRSSNMPYSRVVQLLADLPVTLTWCLPTEVLYWRIAAEANGYPLADFPALRAFWVAGESLSRSKRRSMSTLWGGRPVYEDYGSTETGSLAGECRKGQLHLWSDRIHAEVLDRRTGELKLFGAGHLVVTPLYREAMPLVRYLIDDEVELSPSACECGSAYTVIRVLGRASQAIKVRGRTLRPLDVEEAVYAAGFEFDLVLWRGVASSDGLKIDFFSLAACNRDPLRHFEQAVATQLGVPVVARQRPIEDFMAPSLLTDKVRFSKPRFLFPQGGESLSSIHYSQEAL